MYYAVIQRPETDVSDIEVISKKYDPHYGLVGPHVTLVFPLSADSVKEAELREHVSSVARSSKPFPVRLVNLELSWDQWLFLTPEAGNAEFNALHDNLYGGPLQSFLRTDIPFVPHVALGHFAAENSSYNLKNPEAVSLDDKIYKQAREEIEELRLDFCYTATQLELISVNDAFTQSHTLANFRFDS